MRNFSPLKAGAVTVAGQAASALYRIMVVDDSAVIRGFMSRMLESDPEFKVVATAANGELAVNAVAKSNADLVILDIEMPVMDGLTALPLLLKAKPGIKILISSTLTRPNAAISIKALGAGASDYVPKPTSIKDLHSSETFRREIFDKIKALIRPTAPAGGPAGTRAPRPVAVAAAPRTIELRKPSAFPPAVLAIGSSTGGPQALFTLFEYLKATVTVPIFITQHMPATFTTILAEHLQRITGAPCAEGRDKEPVMKHHIYVAPGEFHMIVQRDRNGPIIRLSEDPPENYCRPAVDPMFRSIAEVYGARTLSIVLTGMGQDGLVGGKTVVDSGGTLIAQDEATSVVWGMPGAVAKAGLCSAALPLSEIAPFIAGKLKG